MNAITTILQEGCWCLHTPSSVTYFPSKMAWRDMSTLKPAPPSEHVCLHSARCREAGRVHPIQVCPFSRMAPALAEPIASDRCGHVVSFRDCEGSLFERKGTRMAPDLPRFHRPPALFCMPRPHSTDELNVPTHPLPPLFLSAAAASTPIRDSSQERRWGHEKIGIHFALCKDVM